MDEIGDELGRLAYKDGLVRLHLDKVVNGEISLEKALLDIIILQRQHIEWLQNDLSVANARLRSEYQ
jgi:hypothetical protein